jgi:serine/threonine protein kinase
LNDAKERATQTLEAVGAEIYIAPEVAKGRVPEPQPTSDLYSLGKVLYFILSGRTLVREEYAEGEDDLRTRDGGPSIHFVYELFDKTITERPAGPLSERGRLTLRPGHSNRKGSA